MFDAALSIEKTIQRIVELQKSAPNVAKKWKRARLNRDRIMQAWILHIKHRLWELDSTDLRGHVQLLEECRSLEQIDGELIFLKAELEKLLERHYRQHERDTLRRLNKLLYEEAGKAYLNGHYEQAIFVAFKTVEVEVVRLSGLNDKHGDRLMVAALNPSAPLIRFSDNTNEQERASYLYRGAVGYIRNPIAHRFTDPNRWQALEYLMFASMLLNLLEQRL